MPPKRRVVKTVRRTTTRSKSKPPPGAAAAASAAVEESPASPQPEPSTTSSPPEVATPPSSAALEVAAPLSSATAAETPLPELVGPIPEPPAPSATAAFPPSGIPPEAASAASADAAPEAAPETSFAETSPAVEESRPTAAEPSGVSARKTTVRVRKVIKKKIVKKRIPKVVAAAKEDLASSQPQAETTDSRPENPSSDAAAREAVQAANENVTVAEEQSVPREQGKELLQEMAASEEKDAQREQLEIGQEVAEAEGKDLQCEKDNEMGQEVAESEEKDSLRVQDKDIEQEVPAATSIADEEAGMSERQRRRKTEIFIGGLGRDAKEDDLKNVFGKVGEIVEVRMMMDSQTGKNKGYAFLRYKDAEQAKTAIAEFSKVEICGKICGAAPLEGNDTIFLGNIDKKWKKEDVMKVLQDIGIEKIDTVTVMADPQNADTNRGFAFLELETNKDAHIAFRKLQKKDIFGIGRNVKVAWAEPFNNPDEEEMRKVKAVYVEGLPSSWHESRLKEIFKKFGDIERIVHSRDIQSAKRKDFAFVNYTTREAALSCIELFDNELTEDGSKFNIKVSLAKPVHKNKPNKGFSKSTSTEKEKPKPMQREVKTIASSYKSFKDHNSRGGNKKASTTNELLQVLREQATWKQGQVGYARGPTAQDYSHMGAGGKRAFPSMGDTSYPDLRGYPRPRLDNSFPVSGPRVPPPGMPVSSLPYYQHSNAGYSGSYYGMPEYSSSFQNQGVPPYGGNMYTRYR